MEKNNKYLLYAGIAIVVVIILALLLPHLRNVPAPAVTPAAPVTSSTAAPATTAADASLAAWNAIFQTYNGKLVVFAADCTATPITQDQNKGTTIALIDNSNTPHTITVGTTVYAIGAFHYRTATLGTSGTVVINCDTRANTAHINVKQ